jgi:hypothetical protein
MRYSGLTGACINCVSLGNLIGQATRDIPFADRVQRYAFETNWSNGEVVQRGTGSNYGQDAFLRPGFRLRSLVDYIYGRACEHFDIGADASMLLTRDWKVKLAAAIVPRGLEFNESFIEALTTEFKGALHEKFEDEVKSQIGSTEFPAAVASAISKKMKVVLGTMRPGSDNEAPKLEEPALPESNVITMTGQLITTVARALMEIVDFAGSLRNADRRISSKSHHQPKSADTFVDDFTIQGQTLAELLIQITSFATAMVLFILVDSSLATVASLLIGVWNIGLSFATMADGARYTTLNEETRGKILACKMNGILKVVFLLIPKDERDSYTHEENPFEVAIDKAVEKFLASARYYNAENEKVGSFESAVKLVTESGYSAFACGVFKMQLVQEFIPKTFHDNSYLQEDLVSIHKAVEELSVYSSAQSSNVASGVFSQVMKLNIRLAKSVSSCEVNYGFMRECPWYRTSLPTTIVFLMGPMLGSLVVSNQIFSVLAAVCDLRQLVPEDTGLNVAIRDLTELYHATTQSSIGSLMNASALAVLIFSLLSCVIGLFDFATRSRAERIPERLAVQILSNTSVWVLLACLPGVLMAFTLFLRKFHRLCAVSSALSEAPSDKLVRRVRTASRAKQVLVLVRLLLSLVVSVILPVSVIETQLGPLMLTDDGVAAYLATGTVALWMVATFLSWLIEVAMFSSLEPDLADQ